MVRISPRVVLACALFGTAVMVCGSLVTRRFDVPGAFVNRVLDLGAEASVAPWYKPNGSAATRNIAGHGAR